MIKIENIKGGWLDLSIGDCTFTASYLTDVVKSLSYLFEGGSYSPRKVTLEGEMAGELVLVAWVTELERAKELSVVWQRVEWTEDFLVSKVMTFDLESFLKEWRTLKEGIKRTYIRNFLMPQNEVEFLEAIKCY